MKKLSAGRLLITVTFAMLLIGFISENDVLADGTTNYPSGWSTIPVTITGADFTSDAWQEGWRYNGEVWQAVATSSVVGISGVINCGGAPWSYFDYDYSILIQANGSTTKVLVDQKGKISLNGGSVSFTTSFDTAQQSESYGGISVYVTVTGGNPESSTHYTQGSITLLAPTTTSVPSSSSSTTTSVGVFSVTGVTPANGSKNIDWEEPGITAQFSKPLDPATVNASTCQINYVCCPTEPINGTFSVSSTDSTMVKFTPSATSGITSAGWNIRVTIKGGDGGAKSTAGEKLAGDYVWTFATLPEIQPEIIPVQVIDGMDLVQNKETVVRVRGILNGASDIAEVPAKVQLIYDNGSYSVGNESATFYRDSVAAQHPEYQLRGNSVNFYSRSGDVPIISTAGSHTIKAIIEPAGQKRIPARSFTATLPVKVRKEKTFRVIYYPINTRLTSNMWNDTNTDFDSTSFSAVMNTSSHVINKLYPVTNVYSRLRSSTIYNIIPTVPEPANATSIAEQVQLNLHLKWTLFALANLNRNGAYDAVVGVVPRPWLDHLLGAVGNQQTILPFYFATYVCLIVHDAGPQISPHEIGHIYLQRQIPNCDAEGHDPRNVTFTGYDVTRDRYVAGTNFGWRARLGLYSSTLMDVDIDGANSRDIWMSRDSYQLLLNGLTSSSSLFSLKTAAQGTPAQVIQILGHLSVDTKGTETVSLQPLYIVDNAVPTAPVSGQYSVELQSATGAVLKSCTFSPSPETIADGTKHDFFLINLENDPAGAQVIVRHNSTVLATVKKSKSAPSLSITSPAAGQSLQGSAVFSWQASDGDGDVLTFDVLYSSDGGETWDILEQNIKEQRLTVDTTGLPGSDNCRMKVVANDGFNTTEAVSGTFTVKNVPKIIATSPAANATEVPPESRISIFFRDPMDAATITAATILLQDNTGAAVAGAVTYNAVTREALFTPASILSAEAAYQLTVSAQVKDALGSALGTEYLLSFTTGKQPDVISVTTTVPGSTTTTTVSGGDCPVDYPVSCADQGYPEACCPAAYPVCCGTGCCPQDHPYCGSDGYCYKDPQTTTTAPTNPCAVSDLLGEHSENSNLLREFRDTVLRRSAGGDELVQLYYNHTEELREILRADPAVRASAVRMLFKVLPSIKTAVAGAPLVIDAATEQEMNRLCDQIAHKAGPELQNAIIALKKKFNDKTLFDELAVESRK